MDDGFAIPRRKGQLPALALEAPNAIFEEVFDYIEVNGVIFLH
jgi:hypothetical protein